MTICGTRVTDSSYSTTRASATICVTTIVATGANAATVGTAKTEEGTTAERMREAGQSAMAAEFVMATLVSTEAGTADAVDTISGAVKKAIVLALYRHLTLKS